MLSEIPPHEKIRFRRSDIASLDDLPSAIPPEPAFKWKRGPVRFLKLVSGAAVALLILSGVLAGAVIGGFGDERLRVEAEKLLIAMAGDKMSPSIGATGVAFDGLRGLSIDVLQAALAQNDTQAEIARIGQTRFSLRFAPLLRGAVEFGGVRISDARIDLGALPSNEAQLGPPFFDERGILDADATMATILGAVGQFATTFSAGGVDRVEFENIEIALPSRQGEVLRIVNAVVGRADAGSLELQADIEAAGRRATLSGTAKTTRDGDKIETFAVTLNAPLPPDAEPDDHLFGAAEITLAGADGAEGNRFTLATRIQDARLPLGRQGLRADVSLDLTTLEGADKVEINRLHVARHRSLWAFHGAVGPLPRGAAADGDPAYRFELVSDGSTSAPDDSPEPALRIFARVAGTFDRLARQLEISEIGARTGAGEVRGNAQVTLEPGKTAGVAFNLDVENVPVAHAKQLWPVFAAPPARNWVLNNVFGGQVREGSIGMKVPSGRLGNGIPLGEEEVWGSFAIDHTRFDVVGRIPAVRDAFGTVEFQGTNVDIALASGTAYSPSGRTVDGANGRLEIRNAHIKPVIGKLDIEVKGDADAVLELARYEPIAVGRFIDLSPDELSGSVSGKVVADIPLQRGIPLDTLDWRVALKYEDLTLSREFEGQRVAEATGSIVVDPKSAVIDAKAKLNGAQATLNLVEPLGADKSRRTRKVAMVMDDGARQAIAPGLDALLSGPARVELEDASGQTREISIGLDRATLSLPWVGWSKGSGVPATAAFAMEKDGNRLALSDFRLEGETFGATGALSLVGGSLERARFPSARLNRGDDFSVDVQAKGRGYAVTIRGKSLDVRSPIKLHLKDAGGGSAGGGASGNASVSVDLQVETLTGFHGERLRDVKLNYSGRGSQTDLLELSAITANGRPVGFRDVRDGDTRRVSMSSTDAGAVLRFLDIYEHMEGGSIELSLAGQGNGPLTGRVDAQDFWVVDEPRLASIVSTAPQGDSRSLNQAVKGQIDTQRVHFERGYSTIVKSTGSLTLDRGVLRGPLIGMTFQGALYDQNGNIALTGTFMPAYGLNRIFGEIPLIGQVLGNGRDRGLIGITFKLAGKADQPQLQINPLSVIAPGIFRSVFEFR